MADFKLRAAARNDLKGIALFTEKRWGKEQRNRYLRQIDEAFHQLAENEAIGLQCDDLRPGYRKFPVGSHVIYYKSGSSGFIEITRILHKRMDVSPTLFKV